jgi:hypothetical protein
LTRVDPVTGELTTLSDFGDPQQGPINPPLVPGPNQFLDLAVDSRGGVFVAYRAVAENSDDIRALFSVDPTNGARTIISDFGDPSQGPTGSGVFGVAVEETGDPLVISVGDEVVLFRVDRLTGDRTIVAQFNALAPPGGFLVEARAMALEASGRVIVGVRRFNNAPGYLSRIDPVTGMSTIVSDFNDPTQGPVIAGPAHDLVIDYSGHILVASSLHVFRVHPVTGFRSVLSNLRDVNEGPTNSGLPFGIVVEESGDILVGLGGIPCLLVRVNPATGMRTLLSSDCSASALAVVLTPVLNDRLSLSALSTSFSPVPVAGGIAGTYTISATFTSLAASDIRGPFFRVVELSGRNMLLNADGIPSGTGARLTPAAGADGVISPGESITVDFVIGLGDRQPFSFLVDLRGVLTENDSP